MGFFSYLLLEFVFLNNFADSLIFMRSPDLLLYIFNYSSDLTDDKKPRGVF